MLAVFLAIQADGCTLYVKDRLLDLGDAFKGNMGVGEGGLYARARVGVIGVPLGYHDSILRLGKEDKHWRRFDWPEKAIGWGLKGRTMMSVGGDVCVDRYMSFLAWREDNQGREPPAWDIWEGASPGPVRGRVEDNTWLEAEAFLGVIGVEVGVNPLELLDFLLGWLRIDVCQDDRIDPSNIHAAIRLGVSAEDLRKAVEERPELLAKVYRGDKPLITAIRWAGRRDVARVLIEAGADANAGSHGGPLPLHCAAAEGYTDIVALLLSRGADVEGRRQTSFGETPLHWAVWRDHREAAALLLEAGADPNARRCRFRHTPLSLAEERAHAELVQLLQRYGGKTDHPGRMP